MMKWFTGKDALSAFGPSEKTLSFLRLTSVVDHGINRFLYQIVSVSSSEFQTLSSCDC
jgi:hypothetical protein